MDISAEQAYELLLEHQSKLDLSKSNSEANTRLRLIDTILFDVLKWQKSDVDVELYCREVGFADYAFSNGGAITLVLEAKRAGTWFVLPDNKFSNNPIGFPLLAKECPEAEKALRQALGYAASLGAKYVAITNGHQWLLALSFVPNQRVDERSVFVFTSIEDIRDSRFREFFNCFSPAAIETNQPSNDLLESRKLPAPPKLSSTITGYPQSAERNVIANEIYVATAAVWDEVKLNESSKEFLENCYIETESTKSVLAEAEELLSKRFSLDKAAKSKTDVVDAVIDTVSGGSAERPVIILGKIGRGKSTFLKYLREIRATEELRSYVQIDINLLDLPDRVSEVSDYIFSEIERQLFEDHNIDIGANNLVRGFLHIELARFQNSYEAAQHAPDSEGFRKAQQDFINGIRADKHKYLSKVFNHLRKGQGSSVAIFLDNLDRRTDDIQEEAFLRASAMARDWSALVFVCLRPGTFYRSSHFGVMDSVEPRIIQIESPKTKHLVTKRMNYASSVAAGVASSTRTLKGTPFTPSISVSLPRVASFLDVVKESFLRQPQLCELFDAVSNNNARELLGYLVQVLRSGHLNTEKIINEIEKNERYRIPIHEALRALIFKDFWQYDPEASAFANLFDIDRADPAEHFSRILLLSYLQNVTSGHPNYGYIPRNSVEQFMFQIGYSSKHIELTNQFLFEKGYIEANIPVESWGPEIDLLRITSRGMYSVSSLVKTFTYLDAVVVDTPIVLDCYREKIVDENAIRARLDRGKIFLDYLNEASKSLSEQSAVKTWSAISGEVASDIAGIRSRLKR